MFRLFFREIRKGGVSVHGVNRWQEWAPAIRYKAEKKLALDFSMEIHLEDRFFIIEIRFCFSCF